MRLFVAGAIFGQVSVILECNFAVFGQVGMSLFGAGAAFPEILAKFRTAGCANFPKKCKTPLQDGTGKLFEAVGPR